jgi:hypothetical protein
MFTKLPAPSPEASATSAISAGIKHLHPVSRLERLGIQLAESRQGRGGHFPVQCVTLHLAEGVIPLPWLYTGGQTLITGYTHSDCRRCRLEG